jgi:hypothetical protein
MIGFLRSVEIFRGFLGEFWGYLEWLGPNRKYFSETEGHAVVFPNVQGPRQNLQEALGPKCKMVKNYGFLGFIFQWKIRWTGSTVLGQGWRGSSPSCTEAVQTRGCGGALPACGAAALGLTGAHRQRWRRTIRMRQ